MSLAANRVELTPLSFLGRAERVFGDRTAVIAGDSTLTYAQFAAHVQHVGRALARRVEPGDAVATLSPNTPELLAAHFAIPLAGATVVTVNTRLAATEIAYILEHCKARLLFVDAELAEVATSAIALSGDSGRDISLVVWGEASIPEAESYAALTAAGVRLPALPWAIADEDSVIAINYTSGTTGRPKGVEYTHRGAYLNSLGFAHHAEFDSETRYLWTLPMFHCNGWTTPWAVTAGGGVHIVIPAVREDIVWDAIDDLGVTHLCGAPTVLSTIAAAKRAHRLARPIRMIAGGAPPAPAILSRLESLGAIVTHAYGLTEVYGPFTICEYRSEWDELVPDERAWRMSRQGVIMLQSGELRVVDPGMSEVPADGETLGEVVLRGNNVMRGYHRDPDATARAFAGGWLHTGDLAVVHADGYIELKDREKDIIVSGGENVSSIEVENALLTHPAISDAAVVAVPDDHWGERPVAYVVADTTLDTAKVRTWLRERLAAFKVPDAVVVLEVLPRTSTGKILKRELRTRAEGTHS